MKRRIAVITLGVILAVSIVACGNQAETVSDSMSEESVSVSEEPTAEPTAEPTPEPTEAPHEHVYTETVTTEATCETDGLKTFACECGDGYTEVITATGHIFENYVYNEDATYLADGTQTATCICGLTDTQTAFGSMLKYTFIPMDVTMYAQQTVNVRNLPCTDGEKIGSLSTNNMVLVKRQCVETGWYEIVYNDTLAYVSDSYLGLNMVVVAEEDFVTPETPEDEIIDNSSSNNGNNGGGPILPEGWTVESGNAGDGGELIDNPNFIMGDGTGNYYDQNGNLVNP